MMELGLARLRAAKGGLGGLGMWRLFLNLGPRGLGDRSFSRWGGNSGVRYPMACLFQVRWETESGE